jgi:selenocysteine lyase/cysteine desulfurase
VIDGTQSVGVLPIDVQAVQPDFLVCSAYKWLLCPYGMAFLYVSPNRQHGAPLEIHGWHKEEKGMLRGEYVHEFQPGARRFDAGQPSDFIKRPMAIAALQQILTWGVANIQDTLRPITQRCAARALELGMRFAPESCRCGHMIGVRFPHGLRYEELEEIHAQLAAKGFFVSLRGDALRISPNVWATVTEADLLFDQIQSLYRTRRAQPRL